MIPFFKSLFDKIFGSKVELLGFEDRRIYTSGFPIIVTLFNVLFFGYLLKNEEYVLFGVHMLLSMIYAGMFWLCFREVYSYFVRKYPGYQNNRKRLWSTLLVSLLLTVFWFKWVKVATNCMVVRDMIQFQTPHPVIEIVSAIIFLMLLITVYEALYSTNMLRKALIEKETLEKSNISSQLMGLRSQINPHFLFNSLNTLTSLIHTDADRAENFATKLAKVYRYMLEHRDDNLTSLKEEIKWLQSYIHLLKERFGNNLIVNVDIDHFQLTKYVLPLCLQITFENAIKHNVITTDRPLTIDIETNNDYLCIKNNLQRKSAVSNSTKFGLENIKKRYNFFTNLSVLVEENENCFKVCLPLLDSNKIIN